MKITIITAFPQFFSSYLDTSIIGKAVRSGKIEVDIVNLLDFGKGKHKQIDDYAYGGGGMVIMAQPVKEALDSIKAEGKMCRILTSPQGIVFTQEMAESLVSFDHLVIVCGHYEGIDERITKFIDYEVSIGDFVLSGGEVAALVIVDAVLRLVPGVVGSFSSVENDSFRSGMLDWANYTRPRVWNDMPVPQELLSGDHKLVEDYRKRDAVLRTLKRRPDLLSRANILPYLSKRPYIMLLHYPVYNKNRQVSTTAVTGLDIHDISRVARTYGIERFLIVTPLASQIQMAKRLIEHWVSGYGATFNPKRGEALKRVKLFSDVKKALSWIKKREKAEPFTVATTARDFKGKLSWLVLKAKMLEIQRPTVFIFGTGWGLTDEFINSCDVVLEPIKGGYKDYNHLSVRTAVAIILDRFFGCR